MKEVIQESYLNSALPLPNVHLDPSPKSPMKVRTSTQRSSRQVKEWSLYSSCTGRNLVWSLIRTSSISLTAGTPVNGTRGTLSHCIHDVSVLVVSAPLHGCFLPRQSNCSTCFPLYRDMEDQNDSDDRNTLSLNSFSTAEIDKVGSFSLQLQLRLPS